MQTREEKQFKELEIILSDYTCDKNCPYCTAKITKWERVEDDIYMLSLYIGQLKELGYQFHYVTIGGNGEPTKHSYQKLKEIVELFDDYEIPVKRVLTSGNVFRKEEKEKYQLFVEHNFMFEVTTTSINNKLDQKILGYNHNYFETEAFKKARIRLNYVLLKSNFNTMIDEIKEFARKYPNIETIALKLLNVNTKTGAVDNPKSEWISKEAIPKSERNKIKEILDQNFTFLGERYDTFSWELDSKHEVYFSFKKQEYGLYDLVYYGNQFVNYQLEPVKLNHLVPKIYIAARFNKRILSTNTFTLKDDFRAKLFCDEEKFTNFNNHSFIKDKNNQIVYQYLGPFYNEKASDGSLTSTACEEVVRTENALIDRCDIFAIYLDQHLSPGSITELTYASFKNKKIIIFYQVEDDITYELKSSNWYPIVSAIQVSGSDHVKVIPVHNENEVLKYFKDGKRIW